jgi:hypothetical protein
MLCRTPEMRLAALSLCGNTAKFRNILPCLEVISDNKRDEEGVVIAVDVFPRILKYKTY